MRLGICAQKLQISQKMTLRKIGCFLLKESRHWRRETASAYLEGVWLFTFEACSVITPFCINTWTDLRVLRLWHNNVIEMLYTIAMKLTSLLANDPKQGHEDNIRETNKILYQAGVQSSICNVVILAIILHDFKPTCHQVWFLWNAWSTSPTAKMSSAASASSCPQFSLLGEMYDRDSHDRHVWDLIHAAYGSEERLSPDIWGRLSSQRASRNFPCTQSSKWPCEKGVSSCENLKTLAESTLKQLLVSQRTLCFGSLHKSAYLFFWSLSWLEASFQSQTCCRGLPRRAEAQAPKPSQPQPVSHKAVEPKQESTAKQLFLERLKGRLETPQHAAGGENYSLFQDSYNRYLCTNEAYVPDLGFLKCKVSRTARGKFLHSYQAITHLSGIRVPHKD